MPLYKNRRTVGGRQGLCPKHRPPPWSLLCVFQSRLFLWLPGQGPPHHWCFPWCVLTGYQSQQCLFQVWDGLRSSEPQHVGHVWLKGLVSGPKLPNLLITQDSTLLPCHWDLPSPGFLLRHVIFSKGFCGLHIHHLKAICTDSLDASGDCSGLPCSALGIPLPSGAPASPCFSSAMPLDWWMV